MSVTLDRDTDLNSVAHLQLDFGDLNLFSPNAIVTLRDRVETVPTTFRSSLSAPMPTTVSGD